MADYTLRNFPRVDYEPTGNTGLAALGALLTGRMKGQEQKEERRRWQSEEDRKNVNSQQLLRQNDISNRRLDAEAGRETRKGKLLDADRRRAQVSEIAKLAAQGRHSEAQALARASAYFDDQGAEQTLGYDPGEAGGVDTQSLVEFGNQAEQQPPPGLARMVNPLRAGSRGSGAPRPAPQPEAPAANPAAVRMLPGRKPRITNLPGGGEQEINPAEGEAFKAAEASRKREQLMGLLADPTLPADLRRTIALQAGLAGVQATGAERAAIGNREGQEDTQAFQGAEGDKNRALRVQLKGMGAKGPKAADVRGDRRVSMQEETGARVLGGDVLTRLGFKETQIQNQKFNNMAADLSTNPNAALDAVTAGSFVKMAQGGTGVISDNDMKAFWDSIGGVPEKSAQWVQKVINGEIAQEKRETVRAAVQELARHAQGKLDEVRGAMEHAYRNSPNYSKYEGQFVGTYFPGARKGEKAPADKGGGGAKPRPQKGATSSTPSGVPVVFDGKKWVPR